MSCQHGSEALWQRIRHAEPLPSACEGGLQLCAAFGKGRFELLTIINLQQGRHIRCAVVLFPFETGGESG